MSTPPAFPIRAGAWWWRSSCVRPTLPFRGLRIEGNATISNESVREARLAISSRYLGETDGRRYVEQRTKPGWVVRLPLAKARTWDLGSILPK